MSDQPPSLVTIEFMIEASSQSYKAHQAGLQAVKTVRNTWATDADMFTAKHGMRVVFLHLR